MPLHPKITRIYFNNGRKIDILNSNILVSCNIREGIIMLKFKRGVDDYSVYYFPTKDIACIAHDDKRALTRVNIIEYDEDDRAIVDRLSQEGD